VAPVLHGADTLFLREDELELGRGDRRDALPGLLGGRLGRIAYKRGERGGILLEDGRCGDWAPRADTVVDPTGAGDAFAAGVWAGWLRGEPSERAIQRGIVGASFAIAAWGPDGLQGATTDDAERRLREWYS
jgi:sugar/nucleoside kinase (ribokinase family)